MPVQTTDRRGVMLLAAETDLDPRTVEGFLRGTARVQRTTRRLIVDAAARLGLAHLVPTAEPSSGRGPS